VEWIEAGTLAAMAELAGCVGITVVGIGGVVDVVVDAGAVVVVVELLELLEQAADRTATVPRATATTAFFIPRDEVSTDGPPGSSDGW